MFSWKTWLLKGSPFSQTRSFYMQCHMNQCVYAAFKGRLLLTNLNALNDDLWSTVYVESQTTAQPTT